MCPLRVIVFPEVLLEQISQVLFIVFAGYAYSGLRFHGILFSISKYPLSYYFIDVYDVY